MDIEVTGPRVILDFGGNMFITETVISAWVVMLLIFIICKTLTSNMEKIPTKKSQQLAEKFVTTIDGLVSSTMGERNMAYAPYIMSLLWFSAFGSLISLFGLRSVTADINTTLAWSLITFVLIWRAGFKSKGVGGRFKELLEPTPLMAPMNVVGELAIPVSMSFRHFGNIFAGAVVSILIYGALEVASAALGLASIPILQIGVPAILSLYFDLFSGCIQAFVFSMLTMVYVSNQN